MAMSSCELVIEAAAVVAASVVAAKADSHLFFFSYCRNSIQFQFQAICFVTHIYEIFFVARIFKALRRTRKREK